MIRYQPRNGVRWMAYEKIFGDQYDGELVKFGAVTMGKIPHDAEKRSKTPDSMWI